MRIGPVLPRAGEPSRDGMFEVARAAEKLGYDSLWSTSHTAIPVQFESRYPYSASGRPKWNAATPWGDALIGQGPRLTEELERFAAEVLPKLPEFTPASATTKG